MISTIQEPGHSMNESYTILILIIFFFLVMFYHFAAQNERGSIPLLSVCETADSSNICG